MRVAQVIVLALLLSSAVHAASLSLDRVRYQQALTALQEGDYSHFQELYHSERGYIARPYLRYHFLMDDMRGDRPDAVAAFVKRYPDLPVTPKLKRAWLQFLASRHRDRLFLRFYTRDLNQNAELYCDDLTAQMNVGRQVASSVQALWLTGQSLPKNCTAVTAPWLKSGGATPALLWARVKLAMHAGNGRLVKRLAPTLAPQYRLWAERWLAMQANPAYALAHLTYPLITRRARRIVRAGVVALGYRSPTLAMAVWQRLRQQEPILGEDNNYVLRGLGLIAAQDHLPEALPWLSAAVPGNGTGQLRRWRVRVALRERAWTDVLMFIDAMPAAWRTQPEWQYWSARALAKTGHPRASQALLKTLASQFGYYGFLAADRLGLPYVIPNVPLIEPAMLMNAVGDRPEIQMAHELFLLHQYREARELWFHAIRRLPQRDVEAAALLASRWGWRDCAVLTIAGTQAVHALDLRFPILYRPLVEADAHLNSIDPAWVYGIIRQESAFIFNAQSSVGALGLMQLMPQTGFIAAREISLPITGDREFYDVANNIGVGTRYLADVLARARDQEPVATAAYNAGPTAASSWLPVKRPLPADIWIDTIPYRQTRGYVKNVLAFTAIYDYLLAGHQNALKTRMAPIPPAVELATDGN